MLDGRIAMVPGARDIANLVRGRSEWNAENLLFGPLFALWSNSYLREADAKIARMLNLENSELRKRLLALVDLASPRTAALEPARRDEALARVRGVLDEAWDGYHRYADEILEELAMPVVSRNELIAILEHAEGTEPDTVRVRHTVDALLELSP